VTIVQNCFACENNARLGELPVRERVAVDDCWRVAHAVDTALPGWLVLVPRRHVAATADLTDAEAASLGSWQVRLSRALHAVTGCTKTYVVQFAEAEGFQHVHFHVVPRMPDLAAEPRGPGVFALLGVPEDQRLTVGRMDELAAALAEHLSQTPPSPPATGPRVEPGYRRTGPAARSTRSLTRYAAVTPVWSSYVCNPVIKPMTTTSSS
jgi:diadenosine tetraphosphate (Ap4A) HIT family hydrolase